ncbi:DUF3987 domain-containing protein [Pseudodesulfovibrio cashew]|uniref:DUF3987 domain-containing protein n=1 Tax=Pseudodesulfovibrio cashew TaxID=2678688 RepID=A0A6I6JTD6_9BACT|nr:DUF3987 domain-containing protein [Pseudodesulfovibrio cashew]QGY40914.1 DUF3987 domain-containing protein [Pseudodesulfovibrio cashew]
MTDIDCISPDFGSIPEELKNADAWIVWKAKLNGEKLGKIPYSPLTGRRVDATVPASGCSFVEASKAYRNGKYAGLGIVMGVVQNLVGIDLDNCVSANGVIEPWAQEIVDSLATYTEISPSGKGLRLFGYGKLPLGPRRKGTIEMYDEKRFLTVTGDVYVDQILGEPFLIRKFQDALDSLYNDVFGSETMDESDWQFDLDDLRGLSRLPDADVVRFAREAKNGGTFSRLYDEGNTESYGSRSEADLALCNMLAFYSGRDPDQMERLFNSSQLCRSKWVNRPDYRERTISMAIRSCLSVFGPQVSPEDEFEDLPPVIGVNDSSYELPNEPEFPLDALPKVISAYIKDTSTRAGCPPEMIAVPVLVTLAGCIGRKPRIVPKRFDLDWDEGACLWGMVVAHKGSRKSSTQRKALEPLSAINNRCRNRYKHEMADWKRAEEVLKTSAKHGKMSLGDDEETYFDIEGDLSEPVRIQPIVEDVTIEAVAELMQHNDRLTLGADELSGFLRNMGRYNRGNDRHFWLKAHTGGHFSSNRKGGGNVYVEEAYVNIIGGIQPAVLKDLFLGKNGVDDGLFERFGLLAYPDKPILKGDDNHRDEIIRSHYASICNKLFETDWESELGRSNSFSEEQRCNPVRFELDAQDLFDRWLDEYTERIARLGDSPVIGFISKSSGLVCRLALVLNLTAWASGEVSRPRKVSIAVLRGAIRLVDEYFFYMWHRAVLGPQVDWVAGLYHRLKTKGIDRFTRRELVRLGWGELKGEAIDRFIEVLLVKRMANKEERNSGSKGGRPTVVYHLI